MHAYHRERVVRGVLRGSRETVGGGEPNASGQHPGDRRGDHRHTMGTQPARRSREAPRHPRRCRRLKRRPPEVAQSLNDARKPRIRDVISAIIHNQVIAEHPTGDTGIPCIESSMRTKYCPFWCAVDALAGPRMRVRYGDSTIGRLNTSAESGAAEAAINWLSASAMARSRSSVACW
jgi:hypothetical protein